MRTVVKIAFKEGNSVLMFDGFGNMYLGETNLKINEGDHGLIETLPKVSLVKKLDDNEEIWGSDDFLLDNEMESEYN